MPSLNEQAPVSQMDVLLHLARRARHAETSAELSFIIVNESFALLPYRQAVFWSEHSGVIAISGVASIEANAPFVHWINRIAKDLAQLSEKSPIEKSPIDIHAELLKPEDANEWNEWFPAHAIWIPCQLTLANSDQSESGGLILASEEAISPSLYPVLNEWMDVWTHAWIAKQTNPQTANITFGLNQVRNRS